MSVHLIIGEAIFDRFIKVVPARFYGEFSFVF